MGKKSYQEFSWYKKDKKYLAKDSFLLREKVKYYWGPRLSNNKILSIYTNLEKTSFPTLYAATSIWDDYADSFANYVHVNILKKPWEVRIYKDNKLIKMIKHCWEEKKVSIKEGLF